jgi:hypothetical protein
MIARSEPTMRPTLTTTMLSAMKILVAGALVSLVSTTSAGAVTTTWNFNPVPVDSTNLGPNTVFTATDLTTTLTAFGFSYTGILPGGPGVATPQNLYLDLQGSPATGYLGVCPAPCSQGNTSYVDNGGLDEYIQLQFGAPWALKQLVLNFMQAPQAGTQDQWYLYGNSTSDLFGATLLASGTSQPSPDDPFGIVGSLTYGSVGTGTITIDFNGNAANHVFQNYFLVTNHDSNDSFGLASFSGEQATGVPEPATLSLLGTAAAAGAVGAWWRKRKKK